MELRTFVTVSLYLQICLIVIDYSFADDEPASSIALPPEADEHKLLRDCEHPDYRTYIKCLKRQKRQHLHSHHDADWGDTRRCFDDCGMEQCNTTRCVHDCHKRCMKKTKETRQIITQYETTCVTDDCDEKTKVEQPAANITTNIELNNVIHNHISKNGKNKEDEEDDKPRGNRTERCRTENCDCVPTDGRNCPPYSSWFGNGLSLVPQIQLVPQITFGLGFGSFGGGYYPHGGVDCSPCSNPFLRYRCDVSCYHIQGSNSANPNIGRTGNNAGGCQSPECVGDPIPAKYDP